MNIRSSQTPNKLVRVADGGLCYRGSTGGVPEAPTSFPQVCRQPSLRTRHRAAAAPARYAAHPCSHEQVKSAPMDFLLGKEKKIHILRKMSVRAQGLDLVGERS